MTEYLRDHTTFHIGGAADHFFQATTEAELIQHVIQADAAQIPLLVLGGGSNLLVADSGFAGAVIQVATKGIQVSEQPAGSGAIVSVAAGETWDEFVEFTVEQSGNRQGFVGIEALSGIPGTVGATPVQNVGAYGQEVSQTIARLRTFDRQTSQIRIFDAAECGFGYRTSAFKQSATGSPTGRWVILEVSFQFAQNKLSAPLRHQELANMLEVQPGERAPLSKVREAVLELRRSKGMVVDEADHDTWSAGSFFTNPVLDVDSASQLPAAAPRYSQASGEIKTSAAWLIKNAGFNEGYSCGRAALSTKHVLAITNRGGASAGEVLELADQIVNAVKARFQVILTPEPVIISERKL
ncbi:MAG: UDP-N-acetylmuramate dehydrogenase [Propionibacteriaceae bacterium]|nr:UDP-N-acetylmuramate dehydrogenase [Propionibacteriaceae bacterium]